MNQLLEWLSGGTLQSDGLSSQVADLVIQQPLMLDDLLEGLDESDDVVRARSADALERVARKHPALFIDILSRLIALAQKDPIPMVRWHIAMLLGDLAAFECVVGVLLDSLHHFLDDESPFVRSWAISSLCIIGRMYPTQHDPILQWLAPLSQDSSIAVRHRAAKAVDLLINPDLPLPKSWVKNPHLADL